MGHSDRIVIADGNFPAESVGKNAIVIRCDGHGVPELLDAILQVFPLDRYTEHPVSLMEVMKGDPVETPIWNAYESIVALHDSRGKNAIGQIERFAFYEEARKAYAIIATGESALYANIMLQKGVVTE
jgi:Fucose dissimilation pathway protein FucU